MDFTNLIVSNEEIRKPKVNGNYQVLSYNEFLEVCDDLSIERDLCIDVNSMPDEDMFNAINEALDSTRWFSLDGLAPEYTPRELYTKIEVWDQTEEIEEVEEYAPQDVNLETVDVNTTPTYEPEPTPAPTPAPTPVSAPATAPMPQADSTTQVSSFHGSMIQSDPTIMDNFKDMIDQSVHGHMETSIQEDSKEARVVLFGSAKGGTGKTFTSLISTYRYAKKHPTERICHLDLDVIGGQVGITIHKPSARTFRDFYGEYLKGNTGFSTMRNFRTQSSKFPNNVDFYLGASSYIDNDEFWQTVLTNAIRNYDLVVIDSGIDYVGYPPIIYAYKIADKINIITSTSTKSVNSTVQQIIALCGNDETGIFKPDDELASKIFVVVTQAAINDPVNDTVLDIFQSRANANVIAVFAEMTAIINKVEFYGFWNIFDSEKDINESLDRIME